MNEIRKRVKNTQGEWKEGVIVDIAKMVTTPTIVELADGARLTVQLTITEAVRVDEEEGPSYGLSLNTNIAIDTAEDIQRQESKNGD